MDNVFFQRASIMGEGASSTVGRPDIFGMHFATDRAFDVILLAVVFGAVPDRRGGPAAGPLRPAPGGHERLAGRLRAPSGLSLTVTKLPVFAGPAGLAGLAGALYGGLGGLGRRPQFQFLSHRALRRRSPWPAVSMLTGAVLAGVSCLAVGPVIGAHIPVLDLQLPVLLIGVGIVAIGRNPNGIGVLYAAGRRLVAGPAGDTLGSSDRLAGAGARARARRRAEVASVG